MAKFELSDEAKAAGLSMGRNQNILQKDRDAALGNEESKLRSKMMSEKYNSPSVVDQYRNLETNPEAKAFPVSTPRKIKEEPLKESKSSVSNPDSNSASNSGSNERLGKMTERLGGSRVGFTVPDISNRKGGVIKMAKGGSVKSSASRRGDGCASKGKTKGRMV
jgi:hypothetical protein